MTRREMLAGALAGTALPAKPAYAPKLVMQPYVWTQHLRGEGKTLAAGLEDIFASAKQAGYQRIEMLNSFVTPELRGKTLALASEYGQQTPIVYMGAALWNGKAAKQAIAGAIAMVEPLRTSGLQLLTVNPEEKPGRERKTDAELSVEASNLNRLGSEMRKRGLRLMIHNHDPQMAEGAREWRNALRPTDPALVWFCIDVHWVYRGHQDPMTLLHEAGERIASLHLRNSRAGVWTESFGDGDIDYRPVAAFLRSLGYRGFLEVELAYEKGTHPSRPLTEDLRLSREYAERIFGVRA
jgi:inosose dehydratase